MLPQSLQIVAQSHESLASQSLQYVARTRPVPSLSVASHKAPPQSSSPMLFSLSKSSITLKTKSPIRKKLYDSDRQCPDFLTDLLEMPCNQLRQKVTSRLRPCSETRPVLAPPGWQYQYWLQWQIGLVFVALLPFSHTISSLKNCRSYSWHLMAWLLSWSSSAACYSRNRKLAKDSFLTSAR